MSNIKNILESVDQKLIEGIDNAGITEHEARMLDQVIKEEERRAKAEITSSFVKGVVLGMLISMLILIVKV